MNNSLLHIALIQASLVWESAEANRIAFTKKINAITSPVDIIVLPEMFTTGFTMNAKVVCEDYEQSPTLAWMQTMAKHKNSAIVGSIIIKDKGRYWNRLLWVFPDGTHTFYDKRHLFRMACEHDIFSSGDSQVIVSYKGWRICPLICYDLRFPVWSRNRLSLDEQGNTDSGYDLLIYVANWPQVRLSVWDSLLKARAIENLAYTVGVNCVGRDGKGIDYAGGTTAIDPKGQVLTYSTFSESVQYACLDMDELKTFRQKFPAYMDADSYLIDNFL